ncbi:MAG TPA: hypothetical protein VF666_17395 [Pyrinomonadaceae bacterium]|jgi:hypothetical protein
MTDNRAKNRALVQYLLLPTIFLTVTLLGGFRVNADANPAQHGAFSFIAPPLVTLLLAVVLMLLFVRGHLVEFGRWLSGAHHPLANVANALTLATLFFASAQTFNSVLPEAGLLRWMFSFFFLWTLWNNLFSTFDARRLLRSLAVLFGTAFVIKHMLLASLYAPDGGWLKRIAGTLLEGATLGTLDAQAFAPANGYVSFFTIALYVAGLVLLPNAPPFEESVAVNQADEFVEAFRQLPTDEQLSVREAIGAEHQTRLIETDRRETYVED